MDFSIPDRLDRLLGELRGFVESRLYPLESRLIKEPFSQVLPQLRAIRRHARQRGWWLPQVPAAHGGMGLELTDFALVSEVLGRNPLGHFALNCQAPDAGNMEILLQFGSSSQKERFLQPLLDGDARSCFAMTEPEHAGSNPVELSTTAVRQRGSYVLNGHKWFTTSADGAAFAVVMAVTDAEAKPHRRASLFLVPTDTSGFELIRNIPVMGHTGDSWNSHGEIMLRDCRIPESFLLGREGAGFEMAQTRLGAGRIHHCMRWIGICERCFDLMCRRAATRNIGRARPLGSRQIVQEWIATSRMQIDAARLCVLQAAWKTDRQGSRAAQQEISCIKFQVAETLQVVIDRAIQIYGAAGVSDDTPLAWFYRFERAARIYDGPDEVHKLAVARRILKDYQACEQ